MSTNGYKDVQRWEFTAAADLASGETFVIGAKLAQACEAYKTGDEGEAEVCGVKRVPKTAGTAWSNGDLLGWDGTGLIVGGATLANCATAYGDAADTDTAGYAELNNNPSSRV